MPKVNTTQNALVNKISMGTTIAQKYYLRSGSSDKVYVIEVRRDFAATGPDAEYVTECKYGRRGASLRPSPKYRGGSVYEALRIAMKVGVEKSGEGYSRNPDGIPGSQKPANVPEWEEMPRFPANGSANSSGEDLKDEPTESMRYITLQFAGNCVRCGNRVKEGSRHWFDTSTRKVHCSMCVKTPEERAPDPRVHPASRSASSAHAPTDDLFSPPPAPSAPPRPDEIPLFCTGQFESVLAEDSRMDGLIQSKSACAFVIPKGAKPLTVNVHGTTVIFDPPQARIPTIIEINLAAGGTASYFAYLYKGRLVFVDMVAAGCDGDSCYADRRDSLAEVIESIPSSVVALQPVLTAIDEKRSALDCKGDGAFVVIDGMIPRARAVSCQGASI